MTRALLLTHFFPPSETPESICTFKRYLRLDWKIDVVASWHQFDTTGASLLEFVPKHPYSLLGTEVSGSPKSRTTLTQKFEKRPDRYRKFNKHMFAQLGTLNLDRYDLMISVSQFHSVHLVAEKVKCSNPSLPWVAHLSDPWSSNPLARIPSLYRLLNARLERRVLSGTDLITVPSPGVGANLECDQSKVAVVRHCHVPELYHNSGETSGTVDDHLKRITIRYIGSLAGSRSFSPLTSALRSVSTFTQLVDVEIIGGHLSAAEAADLGKTVRLRQFPHRVSYLEALNLAATSDGLIIVGDSLSNSPFVPSKFADCVGANKPLLVITYPGPLLDLAKAYGIPVLTPDGGQANTRECARFLRQCFQREPLPESLTSDFSVEQATRDFRHAVSKIMDGS